MSETLNDLQASQLLVKSLSGELTLAEREALESYQADSAEAASFSKLSDLIQQSVVEHAGAETAFLSSGESEKGLSDVARERMKRALRKANLQPQIFSGSMVAEQDTVYYTGDSGLPSDETRQAACSFTLLEKIGEGGLGTVWLARDEKLRRNVAIKEMNLSAAESPKLLQRFRREAEITGHLEHPNVVPLYMSGINSGTGSPFYAMRFLGKQTLADAIREYHFRQAAGQNDPIQFHRLLTTFLDVCQAIAYAHSRGVIHRDLKPENVAIDSFGQVLVLDWGLAKLDSDGELSMRLAISGGADGDSGWNQSMHGDVIGTPLYMAPEQARGDLKQVDARTDIYGLGGILFSILTGIAPHESSNRSSGGTLKVTELLDCIARSDSPKARALNPKVPIELDAICARAMAKEKFARHASVMELAGEVECWIAGIHAKKARYESMRLAGRDLKSRLCVQVRQLAAAAQFMVELPPIQGLVASTLRPQAEENALTWRERLVKILIALAKAKPNVTSLNFSQIIDGQINELVRIERSSTDLANVRSIPQSRLRSSKTISFHQAVLQQFPGESSFAMDGSSQHNIRLISAVAVFDTETEEPFGLACAEAEIGGLIRPELQLVNAQDALCVIDNDHQILFQSGVISQPTLEAAEVHPRWPEISRELDDVGEFLDYNNEYYAARLSLPHDGPVMNFLFRASD